MQKENALIPAVVSFGALIIAFFGIALFAEMAKMNGNVIGAVLGVTGTALPGVYRFFYKKMNLAAAVSPENSMGTIPVERSGEQTITVILSLASIIFFLIQASAFLYGLTFSLFSEPSLITYFKDALQTEDETVITAIINVVLFATFTPLTYSVIFASTPLVGAWIYSNTPSKDHGKIGWASAFVSSLMSLVFNLALVSGSMRDSLYAENPIGMFVGASVIITLFTIFCMGVGYQIAKLFKIKQHG